MPTPRPDTEIFPSTPADAYARCVAELRADLGDGEARAIARGLVDWLTGVKHAHLLHADTQLTSDQQLCFVLSLHSLMEGSPLPHITESIEFCRLEFYCGADALIPRPETELLVETALNRLSNIQSPRIADLGTGTGCIAVSCAHARSDATVFATDISKEARNLAYANADKMKVAERVTIIEGLANDWTTPIAPHAPFDAILSNPPYIPAREIESLDRHVLREPRRALDGGEDGLDPYRALAAGCLPLLKPTGFLACELGAGQFADVRALFEKRGWNVAEPIIDFAGHQRVLLATH